MPRTSALARPLDALLAGLRAVADPSRLRLLAVCAQGEWTVSELVQVLGQSQPRISRHLKILAEAGLLDRFREGGWVLYRRAQSGEGARVARSLCRLLPAADDDLALDRQRLDAVRAVRRQAAERWFDAHARRWDDEGCIGVATKAVDAALRGLFEAEPVASLLDIGTGTGRVLLTLADRVRFGLGIDASRDMLAVARASLDRAQAHHCQVRLGDMYKLPLPDGQFDAAVLHQVLHYADDPFAVLGEARRVLAPGGRLVVVDLAGHDAEWLRAERAHRRLGFAEDEMAGWFAELGLEAAQPVRLAGAGLTVILWEARRSGRDRTSPDELMRRNAA